MKSVVGEYMINLDYLDVLRGKINFLLNELISVSNDDYLVCVSIIKTHYKAIEVSSIDMALKKNLLKRMSIIIYDFQNKNKVKKHIEKIIELNVKSHEFELEELKKPFIVCVNKVILEILSKTQERYEDFYDEVKVKFISVIERQKKALEERVNTDFSFFDIQKFKRKQLLIKISLENFIDKENIKDCNRIGVSNEIEKLRGTLQEKEHKEIFDRVFNLDLVK